MFIHWTFLLLIVWIMAGPLMSDSFAMALRTAGFVLAIFGCIVLHEMGHALAARRYGIATRDITLLPIGGIARLERMPEQPLQELVVALAGPAVNVVIAAIIIPALLVTEGAAAFSFLGSDPANDGTSAGEAIYGAHFVASLGIANVFIVVFNMIPALPMDGGRVLRALLTMVTDRGRATATAAAVGQVVAVGFGILGIFAANLLLVVIAAFVFMGAGAEAQAEQVKSAIAGLPAKAAMLTRFQSLRESQTVRDAARELLAGSQHDFPILSNDASLTPGEVLDAGALVGVLTRVDLVRAMASGQTDEPISRFMRSGCPTVLESEDLQAALQRISQSGSGATPAPGDLRGSDGPLIAVVRPDASVQSGSKVVGLITSDNLAELVMLRAASRRS